MEFFSILYKLISFIFILISFLYILLMASYANTRERFGAIEISPRGYIDAGENSVKNVKDPIGNKDATNKDYVDRLLDIGDIKMSVRNADFYGWLKCDGRSISRTTYAILFAVIGTSFGSVNGSSFNLPDCRGRVLGTLGQGAGLTNRTLGSLVGDENHLLTTTEMPAHTHTINDPGHTHIVSNTVNFTGNGTPGSIDNSGGEIDTNTTFNTTTTSATTGITASTTGNSLPHNIMQPTVFIGHVYIYSGLENYD